MASPSAQAVLRAERPLTPPQRAALWMAGLVGWRRHALAFLLGALAATALSPFDLTPVLLISFWGLVWLAKGSVSRGDAALLGWSFGFGFFLAGLYWIAAALFVDIASFWWLVPFAAIALPAGLALFTAAAILVTHELSRRFALTGSAPILVLAASWALAEWLRGHILTGFPWNLLGYAWAGAFPGGLAMLQSTAVIGIYGLSLLTVVAAALPARLGDLDRRRHWAAGAALLLVALPLAAGALRLTDAPRETVPGVLLRLVQPSIAQTMRIEPSTLRENFQRLLALTASPGAAPVTDVVWPEAAAPPLLERADREGVRRAIAAVLPKGGLLLTGSERAVPLSGPVVEVWNSLDVIDDRGAIIATYDKGHLVPFGEYVPLRGILPMDKITPGTMDFSAGPGPRTLSLPHLPPVSPLICYEAIFPGAAIDPAHRPGWLLNITNDAWYGTTSGPFQHLSIARVRAVEEGLPLVRSANNGVSAVFDAYGRVVGRLDLNVVGVLDAPLPVALPPTPYEGARAWPFWGGMLLLLVFVALRSRFSDKNIE